MDNYFTAKELVERVEKLNAIELRHFIYYCWVYKFRPSFEIIDHWLKIKDNDVKYPLNFYEEKARRLLNK